MELSVTAYIVPKSGNTMEECEDAFEFSLEQNRFAIADGATESAFADRWARMLVKQFVLDPPFGNPPSEDALQLWMVPQQEEWHRGVNWSTLPWFMEDKAKRGAFAAFLGLEIGPGSETIWQRLFSRPALHDSMVWQAFAVGDTCLFHIRDDALTCAFPVTHSEQFGSRPILLASNPAHNTSALKDIRSAKGDYRPGDLIILATDALAKWFLTVHEAGGKPWETLEALTNQENFEKFVQELRTSQAMRNDDTTLAILRWEHHA